MNARCRGNGPTHVESGPVGVGGHTYASAFVAVE